MVERWQSMSNFNFIVMIPLKKIEELKSFLSECEITDFEIESDNMYCNCYLSFFSSYRAKKLPKCWSWYVCGSSSGKMFFRFDYEKY